MNKTKFSFYFQIFINILILNNLVKLTLYTLHLYNTMNITVFNFYSKKNILWIYLQI